MTDRLDELATFVAILDAGSLAGAARRLRRSAPAVTRTLSDLERRLGVRLIERTTRRLSPTDAGRETAARARRLLMEYDAFVGAAPSAAIRGLLRVSAPLAFGRRHMAPIVAGFLATHREVEIELVLNDRNVDLVADDIHLALRIGELDDSSLLARRVGEVRRILVASPDYLSARGEPKTPQALSDHDTIMSTGAQNLSEWRFGPRRVAIRLTPRLFVNDAEAMLVGARAGLGIGRALSYQAADDLKTGALVRILKDHEPPPSPVQLVAPGGAHRPPKVSAFLDHAAAALTRLAAIRPEPANVPIDQ